MSLITTGLIGTAPEFNTGCCLEVSVLSGLGQSGIAPLKICQRLSFRNLCGFHLTDEYRMVAARMTLLNDAFDVSYDIIQEGRPGYARFVTNSIESINDF